MKGRVRPDDKPIRLGGGTFVHTPVPKSPSDWTGAEARALHADRALARAHAAIAEALRHLDAVIEHNTLVSTMRTNAMSAREALLRARR